MGQDDKADNPDSGATRIERLEAALADRDATIAEQQAQIALLTAQVAKLTEQQGRNSKNSHLPPSSDGPGSGAKGRKDKPRGKSGRKRGGQKGHRGSHRELLPEGRVDEFIDLFPSTCLCCGQPLPQVPDAAACRYHYDPVLGQFTTPDPLFFEDLDRVAKSPVEGNLYSYAGNNPVSFVDPTGTHMADVRVQTPLRQGAPDSLALGFWNGLKDFLLGRNNATIPDNATNRSRFAQGYGAGTTAGSWLYKGSDAYQTAQAALAPAECKPTRWA